ncbi:helix-turn-helix domain-containing protein [Paenibacillus cucumis (ex Kampfer et al. 2016)]|uniref:Helix-turn-helix transcriptional regulator n=1 Tax=Paenibacillus cucumis (ex Kampfer et al. 2016) TaxID=1776858 RepID=A0ABS7KF14_9BACL|nr:helix-turn-helix transcriptional regulator [Paenibacillus cucumis (ex Kampfer et al. 2016)]MBY0202730.1 helix-turn-helix transcriptional regulator [Paenibacillus cucumis (ex Kampfer et al. 2016)]
MSELREMIGTRIRAMRNAKGLTQQKLADIAGLDYRYIGALERGERNFSIDTLEKVLLAMNLDISELMYSGSRTEILDVTRQEALDEFIALTKSLTHQQIIILKNVNRELSHAFKTDN